jgi:glycosyltransferase involved in cell wall biosynthesis
MKLSVAIIACNEEANLARTLASVAWASEVIVVDSGSTDHTVAIAQQHGAQVFMEEWKGFAAQKNSALAKCTGDWILSLDADEEVSPGLRMQIETLLSSQPQHNAYFVPRQNFFLGRWIRHGGFYPDAKLRLFQRGAAQFEDRPVHETIRYHGSTGTLGAHGTLGAANSALLHHAYPTLEDYLDHMNRYSTLGAELAHRKGKISRSPLAFFWNVLLNPGATFLYNYFLRLGFLDGREGLLLHLHHSVYVSWKYAKAWQLSRNAQG